MMMMMMMINLLIYAKEQFSILNGIIYKILYT